MLSNALLKPIPTEMDLLFGSSYGIVTRELFFSGIHAYSCLCVLFLCVLLVAMVAVAACCASYCFAVCGSACVSVTLNCTRFRFLEDGSPPETGPLFHWTCRKCAALCHNSAPEDTRSSNDGDCCSGGGYGYDERRTPPSLSVKIISLSRILSLSVSLALFNLFLAPVHTPV